jgi:cytochrome c oxidase subunit III
MTRGPIVRMQALPLELAGSRAPLWWGMAMLVVIEVVAYATLFTAYLYLRFHTPEWPPEGLAPPNLLLGVVGVMVLMLSAATVRWASVGLDRERPGQLRAGFGAAAVLALLFVLLHALERALAGFRWDDNAYASVIWTIGMVHMLHVLTLAVIAGGVWLLARRQFYSRERRLGIEILALFWYTVVAVWLPLFAVVYLVRW